jgi:hypothetical protein
MVASIETATGRGVGVSPFPHPKQRQVKPMHNLEFLIPITLFVCITYAIKAVVDARVRKQLVASNISQELIQSIVEADELRRRHATLRWGAILIALSFGFGLMEALGLRDVTPGVFAILLGTTGVGNLIAYYLSRKMPA